MGPQLFAVVHERSDRERPTARPPGRPADPWQKI